MARGDGETRAWWILAPKASEVKGQLVKVKSQAAQGTSLVVPWLTPGSQCQWGYVVGWRSGGGQGSIPGLPSWELYPTYSN